MTGRYRLRIGDSAILCSFMCCKCSVPFLQFERKRFRRSFFSGQKCYSALHSSDGKVKICSISSAPLTFVLPGLPLVPVLLSSACSAGMATMIIVAAMARRTDSVPVRRLREAPPLDVPASGASSVCCSGISIGKEQESPLPPKTKQERAEEVLRWAMRSSWPRGQGRCRLGWGWNR